MNTDEILASLNVAQRKELEDKLHAAAAAAANDYYKDPKKFGTITTPVQLKDNIALDVTISLHPGDKEKLHPVIEEVAKK